MLYEEGEKKNPYCLQEIDKIDRYKREEGEKTKKREREEGTELGRLSFRFQITNVGNRGGYQRSRHPPPVGLQPQGSMKPGDTRFSNESLTRQKRKIKIPKQHNQAIK